MAYWLYKHIKAKRAASNSSSGSGKENPAKSIKLCEHQRDISLDNIGLPQDISDFATSPQPVDTNQKGWATDNAPSPGDIGPCTLCKEEKRRERIYRWKLIGGLFLPFSVQALDTTIVAGALPFIASDFRTWLYLYLFTSRPPLIYPLLTPHRPTRPAELDRYRLQPHLCHLHPSMGPGSRCLWPIRDYAGCNYLYAVRQCTLRHLANFCLPHASPWESHPRHGLCGAQHRDEDRVGG